MLTKKGTFSLGTNLGNPEQACRVASQNGVFDIRNPLADSVK